MKTLVALDKVNAFYGAAHILHSLERLTKRYHRRGTGDR